MCYILLSMSVCAALVVVAYGGVVAVVRKCPGAAAACPRETIVLLILIRLRLRLSLIDLSLLPFNFDPLHLSSHLHARMPLNAICN